MRERLKTLILNIRSYAEFRRNAKQPAFSKQLEQIADELEAAIQPQWVPVGERLPDNKRLVFAKTDAGMRILYHSAISGWCESRFAFFGDVTHWHEIDYPDPPPDNAQD